MHLRLMKPLISIADHRSGAGTVFSSSEPGRYSEAARKAAATRTSANNSFKRWPAPTTFASVPASSSYQPDSPRLPARTPHLPKLSSGSQSERPGRLSKRLLRASLTWQLQRRSRACPSDVPFRQHLGDPIPCSPEHSDGETELLTTRNASSEQEYQRKGLTGQPAAEGRQSRFRCCIG